MAYFWGIILIGAFMLLVIQFAKAQQPVNSTSKNSTGIPTKENHYEKLRSIAFTVTPEQLNIHLPKNKPTVYGVIMDWDYKGTTITVVAFQTGDASMYFSSGQMFIGGFAHESVKQAAMQLVTDAAPYLLKTEKSSQNMAADKGCVKFHLLTNAGTYSYQEKISIIQESSSMWNPLFNDAQNIITQYRLIEQK